MAKSDTEENRTTPEIRVATDTEDEGADDLCSLNSSEISAVETVLFEASSRRESEYHVYGLVCEEKFASAMVYYKKQHLSRWMQQPSPKRDTEVVNAILSLHCQILAERGESKCRF